MPDEQPEQEPATTPDAADRAGSIVTEHVRSIMEAAQAHVNEVTGGASAQADQIRSEAHEAAGQVLARIEAVEEQLGSLVEGLRADSEKLAQAPGTEKG